MHNVVRINTASRSLFTLVTLAALALSPSLAQAADVASQSCLNSRFADGHIVLHFDSAQSPDGVAIRARNAPAGTVVRISDGAHSVALKLDASAVEGADAHLRAPMYGTDFVISVDSAQMGDDAVCLTDVALSRGERRLAPQMPAVDAGADSAMVVGTWTTTVCNPTHATLRMLADGTWQLRTQAGVRVGSWQYSDGQLQMRQGLTGSYTNMHVISQVVPEDGSESGHAAAASHTILMFNAAMVPGLSGAYTNAAQS